MKVFGPALLITLCFSVGCGSNGGSNTSNSVNGIANLTGNWQFTSTSTVFAATTGSISASLASSGTSVSGVAHISSPCYSYVTDVPLAGQISGNGAFTVSSGTVASQVLTITGTSLGSSINGGVYSIVGGCGGGDKGTISGSTLAPVAGTYLGTLTNALGGSIQMTAQLTQSGTAVGSAGFYDATGNATFISGCFSQATVNPSTSIILGDEYAISFTSPGSSPSSILVSGTFDSAAKTLTVQQFSISGGLCAGSGTGVLNRQ